MAAPKISVIIPTLNRAGRLRETLLSLLKSTLQEFEIIVVDQSDARRGGPPLPGDPRIRYLRETWKNLPNARNVGIRAARTELILFLDDDMEFDADLLEAHCRVHAAHPETPVITGRIRMRPPHAWDDMAVPSALDPGTAKFLANFNLEEAAPSEFPAGCHMSFKRKIFAETGLFDAGYLGNALYEEIDLGIRLKRRGFGIRYEPAVEALHLRDDLGGCRSDPPLRHLLLKFLNTGYFYGKNLLKGNPLPFFRAMKNEIEFYTRTGKGHALWKATLFFAALLAGMARGLARRLVLSR